MVIRNLAASKEAILGAAEAVFAERGYASASLQQIADGAGVSRGMPSYAFGSKEGLYEAVLERAFAAPRALVADLTSRLGTADVRELLTGVVGGYLDFLAAHPTYIRLLQRAALSEAGGHAAVHIDALGAALSGATEFLAAAGLRPVDPRQLIVDILALCFFPLANQSTVLGPLGLDGRDPGFVRQRRDHVVELLVHGLAQVQQS